MIGDDEDLRPYASPPCFLHELDEAHGGTEAFQRGLCLERLMPERPLPPYAYLPGRFPHPLRDPGGHSYRPVAMPPTMEASDPDTFIWGMDLFNHGYYWEAHEAWEALWQSAGRATADRDLLHGLILLAAMGVKLREGKRDAASRHGRRAAFYLRRAGDGASDRETQLGLTAASLAGRAEMVPDHVRAAHPLLVFGFALGRSCAESNAGEGL